MLLLTGSLWLQNSGWEDRLKDILHAHELIIMRCEPGEPTVTGVNSIRAKAEQFDVSAIVAVGGGSVLDTAKALSALLPLREGVEQYIVGTGSGKTLSGPGIPWIAVPTTSGTGTEVTKNAVIKSEEKKSKKSMRSVHLIARYAVIDPELTMELPHELTGIVGLDALTQLIEAFVSKKRQPFPMALARAAFPQMLHALQKLAGSPDDVEARTEAAYGALTSGMALANSGLGAAHGFASSLGGLFDIPHGLICAVFLKPVLDFNAEAIRDLLGQLLGGVRRFDIRSDPVAFLTGVVDDLLRRYGLEDGLRKFHIDRAQIPEIARYCAGSSMSGNPIELSQSDKEELLGKVL